MSPHLSQGLVLSAAYKARDRPVSAINGDIGAKGSGARLDPSSETNSGGAGAEGERTWDVLYTSSDGSGTSEIR